ncbi:MAG: hypothetical protein ACYTDY_11060 [Planctomycetota bacterium]
MTELFVSSPDASTNVKVSGALVTGSDVQDFRWTYDSSWVVCVGDLTTDTVDELYGCLPDGSARTRASGAITTHGDVLWFATE